MSAFQSPFQNGRSWSATNNFMSGSVVFFALLNTLLFSQVLSSWSSVEKVLHKVVQETQLVTSSTLQLPVRVECDCHCTAPATTADANGKPLIEPYFCSSDPVASAKASLPFRKANACDMEANRGGWCLEDSGKTFGQKKRKLAKEHMPVYEPMASRIMALFGSDDVVDLGAGLGQYGDFFETAGRKGEYKAFDGAANIEEFSEGYVTFADLTRPLIHTADWALSLEVGEHIRAEFEATYIANVVKNARKGIVLSWALPDQDGFHHVNGLTNEAVITKLGKLGFKYDASKSAELRSDVGELWWFGKTLMVFRRETFVKVNMW